MKLFPLMLVGITLSSASFAWSGDDRDLSLATAEKSTSFYSLKSLPLNQSGWVVLRSDAKTPSIDFKAMDVKVTACGFLSSPGGEPVATIQADQYHQTQQIQVGSDRFVRFITRSLDGDNIHVLCGKGFDAENGMFLAMPTRGEVEDTLKQYFKIRW